MATTADQIAALQLRIDQLQEGADVRWLSLTGSNCFLMVLGFALLEAGSLRAKNLSMVMLKQIVVACITGVVWYLWGHGLAFGSDASDSTLNNFVGNGRYALHDVKSGDKIAFANWLFQMTFCAVSSSIISGAVGERMKFTIYAGYLVLATGWIYPITAFAQWNEFGWNSPFNDVNRTQHTGGDVPYVGAIDAAGCGPVHIVGGVAALTGAWMVGPRTGRITSKGKIVKMPGHNSALVTIGVLLLWFAWFAFNSGALIIDQKNHHLVIARSVCNTMIASCTAGLVTLLCKAIPSNFTSFPLNNMLGGVLAGLVAITAGSTVVEPWAAFVIGVLSAPVYLGLSYLELDILHIDDPVEAFPVHFGGGILGLFCTGLFAAPGPVRLAYDSSVADKYAGAFMGGSGILIGFNLLAGVFCALWSFFFTFAYFWIMNKIFGLRVSEADEESGLSKMFGDGYDYLTPLQQVQVLSTNLTSLRETLMDGVTHPTSDCGSETSGSGKPSRAGSRIEGVGAKSQTEQQQQQNNEDSDGEELNIVDFTTTNNTSNTEPTK